jgi:hypothetical protein
MQDRGDTGVQCIDGEENDERPRKAKWGLEDEGGGEEDEEEDAWKTTGVPSSAGSSPSSPVPFAAHNFPPVDQHNLSIATSVPVRSQSPFSRAFGPSTDGHHNLGSLSTPQMSSPLFPVLPSLQTLQQSLRYMRESKGVVRRREALIIPNLRSPRTKIEKQKRDCE